MVYKGYLCGDVKWLVFGRAYLSKASARFLLAHNSDMKMKKNTLFSILNTQHQLFQA